MHEDMYRRKRNEYIGGSLNESGSDDEYSYKLRATPSSSSEVDFGAVSLYIPAIQTAFALLFACVASILAALLSTVIACNAVRTVLITSVVGSLCISRPLKMSYARGLDIMFDALRPSMLVYIVSLVCEQLLHSCRPLDEDGGSSTFRIWLFHAGVVCMLLAGLWQAVHPQVQTDHPFAVTFVTLVTITIFAPSPDQGMGPLCDAPSVQESVERVVRVVTFAWVYITIAYACEPTKHSIGEILLCAARATSASVWTLSCNRWLLIMGLIQGILVVTTRVRKSKIVYDGVTDEDFDDRESNLSMLSGQHTHSFEADFATDAAEAQMLDISVLHPDGDASLHSKGMNGNVISMNAASSCNGGVGLNGCNGGAAFGVDGRSFANQRTDLHTTTHPVAYQNGVR